MSTRALRAVEAQIAARPPAAARPAGLDLDGRRAVVATFATLIEGLYAHLPHKRAAYGLDPVQRLRLLDQKLETLDEDDFHRAMFEIVTGLRDAHTRYVGPAHVAGAIAFLPMLIERYSDGGRDAYLVSKLFAPDDADRDAFAAAGFAEGVEISHWNGVPIARALVLYADRETGGRPDARRARALESLTLRALRYSPPPDEDWVVVSFLGADGALREIRLTWLYAEESDAPRAFAVEGPARHAYAGDGAAEATRRVRKMLYAPEAWYADRQQPPSAPAFRTGSAARAVAAPASAREAAPGADQEQVRDVVTARVVDTAAGRFGHLRLWSFDVSDDDAYLAAVVGLLEGLPRHGLILDLRGNPGGLIWAAERLLQLFTPDPVAPVGFTMLATDLTRGIAAAPQGLRQFEPWRGSLASALSTGERYSRAVPLTPPERCNDIGQVYPGPVVAVVDARTYSAADLFAAGFVDHKIGALVCVDEATGAGGANVWYDRDVRQALRGTPLALRPLPEGVSFTIAFRRAMRLGGVEGSEIEDVGIRGQFRRPLTRRDLTDGNRDLLDYCGRLLASEPSTDLVVRADANGLDIETNRLDRVDVYVDRRPIGPPFSADRTGTTRVTISTGRWSEVEIHGFTGDLRRQRRLLRPS